MDKKLICRIVILAFLFNFHFFNSYSDGNEKPVIFPIPSEVRINEGIFSIDKSVFIMVPEKESKTDSFLAGLLFNEFDR